MRLRQLRGWMVRLFGIFNRARRNLAILQFVIADCRRIPPITARPVVRMLELFACCTCRRNAVKPQPVLHRPPDRMRWQRHNVGHGVTQGFAEAAQTSYRGPQAAQKRIAQRAANPI